MIAALILTLAQVTSWPAKGCVREPCCGAMASEVDRLPIVDISEWLIESGDAKQMLTRLTRRNAAIQAFTKAHGKQGLAALRTRGVTTEGNHTHMLLLTQNGRLRIGYDNRDDDWGDRAFRSRILQ